MSDLKVVKAVGGGYMRLKTLDVAFSDGVNVVGGGNGAGKSSLLSCLLDMQGKGHNGRPKVPKNNDSKKGEIIIELGPDAATVEYNVRWLYGKNGKTTLTVTRPNGEKVEGGPQAFLDGMVSRLMDPWEFIDNATGSPEARKKAIKAFKELMVLKLDRPAARKEAERLSGVSVDPGAGEDLDHLEYLASIEAALMDGRRDCKKSGDQHAAQMTASGNELPVEARALKVRSAQELINRQADVNALAQSHLDARRAHEAAAELLKEADAALERAKKDAEIRAKMLLDLPPYDPEEADKLAHDIINIESHNELARAAERYSEMQGKVKEYRTREMRMDRSIDYVRAERERVMEEGEMPVDGLTIEDGEFYLRGVPLADSSTAERLEASFEIGAKTFGVSDGDSDRLRVLVCRSGEVMLKPARERLAQLCDKYNVQVILEVAMDKAKPGIIFVEDGVAVNV